MNPTPQDWAYLAFAALLCIGALWANHRSAKRQQRWIKGLEEEARKKCRIY